MKIEFNGAVEMIIDEINELRKIMRRARALGGQAAVDKLRASDAHNPVMVAAWACVMCAEENNLPIY
jgi:hypothetical protein